MYQIEHLSSEWKLNSDSFEVNSNHHFHFLTSLFSCFLSGLQHINLKIDEFY